MMAVAPEPDSSDQRSLSSPGMLEFQRFTEFESLPGYEEIRLQQGFALKMGMESPFFLVHEGRAGARTTIGGRDYINFSSYDYLGLNGHPVVIEAAKAALDRYGVSCSASRLVAGERPAHRSLEIALASHYHAQDCLVFVSGYMTNVGVIGHIIGEKDLVICDAAIHNSALMGSVLSKASRRTFPHNDLDALEKLLASHRRQFERCLIVVEGLYSMDGDFPDLARLIDIKQRYASWLMVDEAHSLGTMGRHGFGLAEHFGVAPGGVDIWMGTLSKTLAGCGGYIAGSRALVEYLKLTAGAFVYSVGLPPAIAASCEAALSLLHSEPERVERQQRNARMFLDLAKAEGLDTGHAPGTAVTPVVVKDSLPTVLLANQLFQRGINVQPIIHPAVPAKASRLRFFISSEHSEIDLRTTVTAIAEEFDRLSIVRTLAKGLVGGISR
jgi:8-amino-7-oxononanoate synthase